MTGPYLECFIYEITAGKFLWLNIYITGELNRCFIVSIITFKTVKQLKESTIAPSIF